MKITLERAVVIGAVFAIPIIVGLRAIQHADSSGGTVTLEAGPSLPSVLPEPTVPPQQKFYITGGRTDDARGYRDDNAVPPLVACGQNRLDALGNSGITVWTETEYWAMRDRQGNITEREMRALQTRDSTCHP